MGTDVNFGEVTRQLIAALEKKTHFRLRMRQEVRDLVRLNDGRWQVTLMNLDTSEQRGNLQDPKSFIHTTPHMSFVWGDANVDFLRKRFQALQKSTLFRGMRYSEDRDQIAQWIPLVMKGRDPQMVERLNDVAVESSNGWNNAGTGHAALAELNYTPQKADGSIDIAKAVAINESFQMSRQFWAHHVQKR
ncbi:hypothetical protein CRX72_28250 [Pantoea sp. BRM17]|nr:hypothetical protein CRX72_28250 [Pantoea sp. BRM17]